MKLPIEDRLRDIYEELPRSERLLADIIIDFPGDLATHSISELVIRANTSNAAATRLIKRLGYKDFREIRKQARDAKEQGSPRYLHTIDHHSGDFKSEIKQHVDCEVQNLLSSFDALSEEMLEQITENIETADNIWVIGYGNSYMPAMYLRQQLIQLRQCVEILPRPGQAIEKDLSGLSERDLLVVLGFRRRKDVIYRLMRYAQELGTRVLYVTDHSEDKTAGLADWTIRCMVKSTSLFDSYISAFSVLNYICASVSDHLGRAASERLSRAERLHDIFSRIEET
ncbi:MurR/RpiR family transcriptional regulator [Pseudomonas lalucatii]|uniref:MurR/RpiR family transcriptional regulator n=1 Tax=Pseudomonas lalucatii TaxID=1424203 RepID=A0ABS5PWT5_9PSED|nr:MurR/RpiR family transcriptional regulator [Pseudomonas lalucatii]MBS7660834.1 MurR/RpiR family transcriptional regulator [Pseudomonas lalucatii]MBS7691459.1 MurR/RpiR family transcriptional regulator [Pseudomonas lalucatii]MBS7724421.1 MurR/RpiR family transcriptional regulator [Pseudomonas lalucatii]QVM87591.1 MurR/RpiR family transcriptional regulator [Pseudomonas lalucatii]